MKEQMFSCVDEIDGMPTMLWLKGGKMRVSSDLGDLDPWRDSNHEKCQCFESMFGEDDFKQERFTDLHLVWEREA